ncbi:MAG: DNA cytosine methyltransferase [Candidatus Lokiarchaeota archaeon]|nr:DNA cytosine methyltransferase [Candidatus Lokiarchaeota archaeon]
MPRPPRVVDLFCGAGGLSRGFEDAGFEVVASVDIEPRFEETFNKNHKNPVFRVADLSDGLPASIEKGVVDVVIGSPPCQGFSDARGSREARNAEQEARNNLPLDFVRVVEQLRPKVALMENVSGMGTFKLGNRLLVDVLVEAFDGIGYDAVYEQLNSAHYGVPQERVRVFGLAIRKEYKILPVLNKCDLDGAFKDEGSFVRVGDAFSGLPPPTVDGTCEVDLHAPMPPYVLKMRERCQDARLFNHEVVEAVTPEERAILPLLGEGKIYRSSRFGDRYVGVWELYSDRFREDERQLLHFLCRKRTSAAFKEEIEPWKEGYIRPDRFPRDEGGRFSWSDQYPPSGSNQNRSPEAILDDLHARKWLRKKEYRRGGGRFTAFDINTRSGIRPLYLRLSRSAPSRTIMTTSFRARELVHPTEHRAISLREGARIQSFPDDFVFYGHPKNDVTRMIGNAVPPLMGREIARYVAALLGLAVDGNDRELVAIHEAALRTRRPINTLQPAARGKARSLLDFIR